MLKCYICGNINNPESLFCGSCGNKFLKPKLQKTNKTNLYIILGILGGLFVMCCGCNLLGSLARLSSPSEKTGIEAPETKTEKSIKVRTSVDLFDLSNKTIKEVETILGSAKSVSEKKNKYDVKGFIEGEERVYSPELPEKSSLTIFFFKGKSVELKLEGLQYWDKKNKADELAKHYGFGDTEFLTPNVSDGNRKVWKGIIKGLSFSEIVASKSTSEYFDKLTAKVLNAEIERLEKVKEDEEQKASVKQQKLKSSSSTSNGYIRGPRGGCYYITNGYKQYVDRSLCN
jgi:hypothetical protein